MIKCGENNNGKAMSVFILLESQCFAQRRRAAVDGGDVAALRLCRLLKKCRELSSTYTEEERLAWVSAADGFRLARLSPICTK